MAVATPIDTDIHLDVISELDWDPTVDATEAGVEADDRVVTLTGTVESFWKRWTAEQAALRLGDVRALPMT